VSQVSANPTLSRTDLADAVCVAVIDQLERLRFDRAEIEAALACGNDPRIPSRKALVVIARVTRAFGVSRDVIRKSDLKPEQVTSVGNLIDLLARRIGESATPS
jgi:hypothetical protein